MLFLEFKEKYIYIDIFFSIMLNVSLYFHCSQQELKSTNRIRQRLGKLHKSQLAVVEETALLSKNKKEGGKYMYDDKLMMIRALHFTLSFFYSFFPRCYYILIQS